MVWSCYVNFLLEWHIQGVICEAALQVLSIWLTRCTSQEKSGEFCPVWIVVRKIIGSFFRCDGNYPVVATAWTMFSTRQKVSPLHPQLPIYCRSVFTCDISFRPQYASYSVRNCRSDPILDSFRAKQLQLSPATTDLLPFSLAICFC